MHAQDPPAPEEFPVPPEQPVPEDPEERIPVMQQAPLLYVDCDRCDFAHLRREIDYVNHVRDPALARSTC